MLVVDYKLTSYPKLFKDWGVKAF